MRSIRCRRAGISIAGALVVALSAAAPAASAAVSRPSATQLFATPSSIAAIGPWIAVADHGSSSLTLLAASNGALVRRVGPSLLKVPRPTSLVASTVSGRRVLFAAGTGGDVAELSLVAAGTSLKVSRLAVLKPSGCGRSGAAYVEPDAHGHLVEACQDGVVIVWRTYSGTVVRTIPASRTKLTDATGLAVLGADAVVTNAAKGAMPDGVAQLSIGSGARLRTVTNANDAAYGFSTPSGIATDGTNLYEINAGANTVDELTGPTLRFVSSSSTNLSDPGAVIATKSFVWVSSSSWPGQSSMVTQFQVVNNQLQSPWMMCNSNGPYQFDNPSGFALRAGTLWVANAANDLVDQMNAGSGALDATYT